MLPDSPKFQAKIDIDVSFARRRLRCFYLNAKELEIGSAEVNKMKLAVEQVNENFIALRAPSAIPAGAAKLHFEYSGKVSPKNSEGIFVGRDGDVNYLFTQFESIDARRAFPCFDQPDFKTPWQITLHVRSADKAFANTPQVSEAAEAGGMKKVVFAPTKPLPSYLVAFAVGPFEVIDAGKAGANGVSVRIIVPKGKINQAKYAADVTATIVDRLQNYFGIPYPYEKIDTIAVPLFFGAMENAGLITYAQGLLLADPTTDTELRHRQYASIEAHELAHQWFGDLVTLAWWDDTWLNEAFATWTASKILAEWKPEWKSRLGDLGPKFGAMSVDGLVTTRKIHQEILTNDDISNAFDDITYEKGAAVIRMFEVWAGEKQFQSGVTSYLKHYANKNARMGDFLDSISQAGQPRLGAAFETFLDQAGVPEISVALECSGAPSVRLSQKRYLPIGSKGSAAQVWQVPVCVRYRSGNGVEKECFLLDKTSAEFKLTKARACPALIAANESASGYYISSYEGDLLDKMVAGAEFLYPAEQLTLIHDISSLAGSGDLKIGRALDAAVKFANSPERLIAGQARGIVGRTKRLLPPALLDNYARFVLKVFGERARSVGWSAKAGEDQETKLLRAGLIPSVARYDPVLAAEGRKLADGLAGESEGCGCGHDLDRSHVGGVSRRPRFVRCTVAGIEKDERRAAARRWIINALGSRSGSPNWWPRRWT